MKKLIPTLVLLLLFAHSLSCFAQKEKKAPITAEEKIKWDDNMSNYKARKRRDSADIASLHDSIKNYPKKLFPHAAFFDWRVSGLDTAKYKYTRPSFSKKDTSSKAVAPKAPEPDRINYYVSVKDSAWASFAEVSFYRFRNSKEVRWYSTFNYLPTKEKWEKAIPAEVLQKIKKELKEQANEDISSIDLAEYAEAWLSASQYEGDKVKKYAGSKPLPDKKYYRVSGTLNGSKTNGGYFFTLNGEYVPIYEHDAWYNKKLKFE